MPHIGPEWESPSDNNAGWAKTVERLNEKNASLRERIASLEAALEPFAREAWSYEPDEGDDDQTPWGQIKITLGDLRRARSALASSEPPVREPVRTDDAPE